MPISYQPQKMIRGSTATIKVYVKTDVHVSDLGTPILSISQNLVLLEPPVQDGTDQNGYFVQCTLTEEESLLLTAGINVQVQLTWVKDDQRFKGEIHQLYVSPTLIEEATE